MADAPHQFSKVAEELVSELRGVPYPDPKRSKRRPTRPLSELVEHILQTHKIGRDSPEHTIRDHWREIVGPASAAYSHPARLQHNLLTVLAAHSVVRNELFHHRDEIVTRIRQLPGCGEVKAIKLVVG
jgi:hypothetical protein